MTEMLVDAWKPKRQPFPSVHWWLFPFDKDGFLHTSFKLSVLSILKSENVGLKICVLCPWPARIQLNLTRVTDTSVLLHVIAEAQKWTSLIECLSLFSPVFDKYPLLDISTCFYGIHTSISSFVFTLQLRGSCHPGNSALLTESFGCGEWCESK